MEQGKITRPPREIIESFKSIPTTTISDVLDSLGICGIINGFRAVIPGIRVAGAAFTVKSIAGERNTYSASDFSLGQVIDLMEKDDIFVCDLGGQQVSHAGGLASTAMKLRGVRAMVIDGGCRDIDEIVSTGFPTYTRHVCATTGRSRIKILATNIPVEVGSVRVYPGDVVVADDTSVAIIPADKAREVLVECQKREKLEQQFVAKLKEGGTFLEAYRKLGIM